MKTEYFFHTKNTPRTTVGGVYDPETETIRLAKATCGPNDHFEKKIGRAITIGRIKAGKAIDLVQVDPTLTTGQAFVAAALTLVGLNEVKNELEVA